MPFGITDDYRVSFVDKTVSLQLGFQLYFNISGILHPFDYK